MVTFIILCVTSDSNQNTVSISGIYSNSERIIDKAGHSGDIDINAKTITLHNGLINTSSQNAGGGDIYINNHDLLLLEKANITTSVQGGSGDGGNITINNPDFVIMNGSKIIAQANEGHGGNIHIIAEQFITSPNSLISASSKLGIDGEIKIDSPDIDMEGFLVVLSDEVVEASSLIKRPCSMRGSSFTVQKINGSPLTPYDYQSSTYLLETNDKIATTSKNSDDKLDFSTCKK